MLASGSDDTTVRLWDMRTGQGLASLRRHTQGVSSVVFSPDGAWLASGSSDGDIMLWDSADGAQVAALRSFTGTPAGVVFSGDGYVDVVGPNADVARLHVRCRVGPVMVPFPVCAERYEVTGLLGGGAGRRLKLPRTLGCAQDSGMVVASRGWPAGGLSSALVPGQSSVCPRLPIPRLACFGMLRRIPVPVSLPLGPIRLLSRLLIQQS